MKALFEEDQFENILLKNQTGESLVSQEETNQLQQHGHETECGPTIQQQKKRDSGDISLHDIIGPGAPVEKNKRSRK